MDDNEQARYREFLIQQARVKCNVERIGNKSSISCPDKDSTEKFRDFLVKKKKKIEYDQKATEDILDLTGLASEEFGELAKNVNDFNDKRLMFVQDELNLMNSRVKSLEKAEQEIQLNN